MKLRRLAFGLATVLGIRRRGWFIPHRYANRIDAAAARAEYSALRRVLRQAEPDFLAVLAALDEYGAALAAIAEETTSRPRFDQDWFPTLDAAAAYVLVRQRRPRRIVEVGGGHSTRFLARAVADGGLATTITTIDPAPRAAIEPLGVRHIAATIQETGLARFEELAADDVLFVDSSHVLMPGSDVDVLLNRILPALVPGVILHFHDIFLPDPYPQAWDWRGYNEQNALAPLLTLGRLRPLFASHYVETALADRLARTVVARLPRAETAMAGSLWAVLA